VELKPCEILQPMALLREKLYKPVQRENRIVKKAIKLGVNVSGV